MPPSLYVRVRASARQEAGFGATGDVTVLRVTSSARLSYSAESNSKLCELCLFKKDWFRKKDLLFQINAQKEFDSQFMQLEIDLMEPRVARNWEFSQFWGFGRPYWEIFYGEFPILIMGNFHPEQIL